LFSGLLVGSYGPAAAQEKQDEKDPKETIKVSKKEESAIRKIEKAKNVDETLKLSADFIKEFPQSAARKQVVNNAAAKILELNDNEQLVRHGENYLKIFTPESEADVIMSGLIYSYVQIKRPQDAFDKAKSYLARHPEDVSTRLTLAIEGSNQVRMGNKQFAAPAREYAAAAAELIEADKRPADINETRWQEYKTKWLPQLYQSIGIIDFNSGDAAKARASFEKAVALDPKDINSWVLIGTIMDDEYQTLALKYNAAGPGAERDELLKQANEKMDAVIDIFARVVALTDGKPEVKQLNEQVRGNLENYYKFRHKNTDGMQALIDKYKN
jgi:tetratricopeptide (TPR) repeat protein